MLYSLQTYNIDNENLKRKYFKKIFQAYFDQRMKTIFRGRSWYPFNSKHAQKIKLCIKQVNWKFEADWSFPWVRIPQKPKIA